MGWGVLLQVPAWGLPPGEERSGGKGCYDTIRPADGARDRTSTVVIQEVMQASSGEERHALTVLL